MLKTFVTGLLLSSGLLVGIGANTIAPDAELPVKERLSRRLEQTHSLQSTPDVRSHNIVPGSGSSRRVALVGRSSSKMRPGFFGQLPPPGAGTTSQNPISGYNLFPYSYLACNALMNLTGKRESSSSGSGGFADFSTSQGQFLRGGDNGILPYTGFPYYYAYSSSSDDDNGDSHGLKDGEDKVPVPEPSTFIIMGSGLLALCYVFYRKHKRIPVEASLCKPNAERGS